MQFAGESMSELQMSQERLRETLKRVKAMNAAKRAEREEIQRLAAEQARQKEKELDTEVAAAKEDQGLKRANNVQDTLWALLRITTDWNPFYQQDYEAVEGIEEGLVNAIVEHLRDKGMSDAEIAADMARQDKHFKMYDEFIADNALKSDIKSILKDPEKLKKLGDIVTQSREVSQKKRKEIFEIQTKLRAPDEKKEKLIELIEDIVLDPVDRLKLKLKKRTKTMLKTIWESVTAHKMWYGKNKPGQAIDFDLDDSD